MKNGSRETDLMPTWILELADLDFKIIIQNLLWKLHDRIHKMIGEMRNVKIDMKTEENIEISRTKILKIKNE